MVSQWIHGEWLDGDGPPFQSICPARGDVVWSGREASPAQVARACQSARAAFAAWSGLAVDERIAVLRRYRQTLSDDTAPLAELIAHEVGKPLWEARSEVTTMLGKVEVSIQAYHERSGQRRTAVDGGVQALSHRAHGVLAVLGPYNFPGHLPNGHIVPALLAGNTLVFKPSEYAPGVALRCATLWRAAGLPPGVLNIVNGGPAVGRALTAHDAIVGVLFTGSYATGAAISRQFAGQPEKLLALEMGGNNPLVVWGVADVSLAVQHVVASAYLSAGQRCTCARRLIVDDGAAGQALIARLLDVLPQIRVGCWNDEPPPFMGPVVSAAAARHLLLRQQGLIALGARPLLPMRSLAEGSGLLSPGLLDVTKVAALPDEEIFGPLLQVLRVADFDAAIEEANRTRYGLAAGLLADDAALWERFAPRARAGIVNWNRPTTGAASSAPFGGIGRSGNHRPSAYYAADYCAYPVASMSSAALSAPAALPGLPF